MAHFLRVIFVKKHKQERSGVHVKDYTAKDIQIFSWKDVEASGELERLRMVIEVMPDEELMEALESERKGRRDDYPVRAVWNSILAGIVYQHTSIESLRRELLRNAELKSNERYEIAFC